MIAVSGFQVTEQLFESIGSIVFRAKRESDRQSFVLKLLNQAYPSSEQIARFRREFEITRSLADIEGVLRVHALEPYANSLLIIQEDFGGESLDRHLSRHPLKLENAISIAERIATSLGHVHQREIMHKDISPANVVWNPTTDQVALIDFGLSTALSRESPQTRNPYVLEGTLPYMSPEQTGRMNRALDYRTDLYSLGATLYELLTGRAPFPADDPMGLVHAHLAKVALPPHQVNSEIAPVLSDIIMRLLAKQPEDRYKSAFGVAADLRNCLTQITSHGRIAHFQIRAHDVSDLFQIPQLLYGRQQQVQRLLDTFDRVALGAKEMLLVAGYSGIGKSSLVHEVQKPILAKNGNFIEGKFDQFKRNIPYASLIQAFQKLVLQLLTEPEDKVLYWKQRLRSVLGSNGKIIVEVIPEIELVIGTQEPVPALPAAEANNRFNYVFKNFVRAFSAEDHPLVIFLDDLQWTDNPTLKMLELLMCDEEESFILVIGAYRDNEIHPTHSLLQTLDNIGKSGGKLDTITLTPLGFADVNGLISDTLFAEPERCRELTKLCLEKTQGNPFFLNQFLHSLHDARALEFDSGRGVWQWDIDRIRAMEMTDNVVELMANKINKLQTRTRDVLKMASCIGASFDLATLSVVSDKPPKAVADDMWDALKEGLVIPIDDAYKFVDYQLEQVAQEQSQQTLAKVPHYRFLHDRVQQAAYSLIPTAQSAATHLMVGQRLWQHLSPKQRDEQVFDIANHLNHGAELLTTSGPRHDLAALNLKAGKKAKASSAYMPAFNYLKAGLSLLDGASWRTEFDLSLDLHIEAAEAAYLVGDFGQMQQWIDTVLTNTDNLLHQVKVCKVLVQARMSINLPLEAIEIALSMLRRLGMRFPKKRTKLHVLLQLAQSTIFMLNRDIAGLRNLPRMTDPMDIAVMELMNQIYSASYIAEPNQMVLTSIRLAQVSIRKGNIPVSAFGYASYGLVLCGVTQDIKVGHQFGKLALLVQEDFQANELKCRTWFMVNNFVWHWKEPLRDTLEPLLEAYRVGLETGELEFAGYSAFVRCAYAFFAGSSLREREEETAKFVQAIAQINQQTPLYYNQVVLQTILNLRHDVATPERLLGTAYNEETMLPLHMQANDMSALSFLFVNKLLLCYWFRQYPLGLENMARLAVYKQGMVAMFHDTVYQFYAALTHLALIPRVSLAERARHIGQARKHHKKIRKWAEHAPTNQSHRDHLISAEIARHTGDHSSAALHYKMAIKLARENLYLHEEGLAYELYAAYWADLEEEEMQQLCLKQACHRFELWGADAKVRQLKSEFACLRDTPVQEKLLTTPTTFHGTVSTTQAPKLDASSLMKASRAISGEIVLERLLQRLMMVVIENAGAQTGCLLLEKGGDLFIEAQGSVDHEEVRVLQSIPVALEEATDSPRLPVTIIRYVGNTRSAVVLADAAKEGAFSHDPYVLQKQAKSVLCAPIQHQGRVIGQVYLENSRIAGAFTPDRLEFLNLLSSQIAISIENARIYENLENTVRQRTASLEATLKSLRTTQAQLEEASLTDPLTGLRNRRFLEQRLDTDVEMSIRSHEEWRRSPNHAAPVDADLVFFLVDIDHFKRVNDMLGHAAGDQVLMQMRERLQSIFRVTDYLIRWGGEEFLIVARQVNRCDARMIAEKLRQSVAQRPFMVEGVGAVHPTCSVGFACYPFIPECPRALSWEQVVALADRSLYRAKAGGRNTWVGVEASGDNKDAHHASQIMASPQDAADMGLLQFVAKDDG